MTASSASSGVDVDVGIPTYRRPEWLRESLTSALGQSRAQLNVTVVDNASGDSTTLVVGEIGDPRVTVVTNPTTVTRIDNYNRALFAGSSPYVAVLADDDQWKPTFLEHTAAVLDSDATVVLVHCGYDAIDEAGSVIDSIAHPAPGLARVVPGDRYIEWLIAGTHRVQFTGSLIRRTALPPGGFATADEVADDLGLLLRVAQRGRVAFAPEPLVRVRMHDQTVSAGHGITDGGGYVFSLAWREQFRDVKLRFVDECVTDPSNARRLRKLAHRTFRRQLLSPVARALRHEGVGAATAALRQSLRRDPRALVDPQAWKWAAAALLQR